MLKQGSVGDIKRGVLTRDLGHLTITMRFYPRFLRKELRDEFLSVLAPVRELLHEFNGAQKKVGHNQAFAEVDYERRFNLTATGLDALQRLAEMSVRKDVYLVCICALGEKCHREMLMMLAHKLFGCKIGQVYHDYPDFRKRLGSFDSKQNSVRKNA